LKAPKIILAKQPVANDLRHKHISCLQLCFTGSMTIEPIHLRQTCTTFSVLRATNILPNWNTNQVHSQCFIAQCTQFT